VRVRSVGLESYHELCRIGISNYRLPFICSYCALHGIIPKLRNKPIKHSQKHVDSPAEIAECTYVVESPGKAYVEVGLINQSAAFVMMLKRI
jgi:hypothetical protein